MSEVCATGGAVDPVPIRILALWCPDWPAVAAAAGGGLPPHRPVAVVAGNRVVACSAWARAEGVRRGLRRREAQARCPELAVFPAEPDRDARLFEPVAVAVEELAPGIEVVRPGLVALPVRGAARYFGGEPATVERLVDQVAARAGVECQVGVAEGLFAAALAARRGVVVPPGRAAAFLAPLPAAELDAEPGVERGELVSLLRRLGLRTLGSFAALPASDVASRFEADAVLAHRLARGLDPRPPARRRPPDDLEVRQVLDPPVVRVDAAAFVTRALAEQLHAVLAAHGLACTRLGVRAQTGDGRELARVWRCAEPLTPAATADRVRWQLDAWLAQGGAGAVSVLRLVPEEVVDAGSLQLGLWGDVGAADERAGRALVRVQAMLGPEAVLTAVLGGGRDPRDRVRLVPWGEERSPARAAEAPWPGRLPAPSPATVPPRPLPAAVLDASGAPVGVTDRYLLTAPPARVVIAGAGPAPVLTWAGPWPVDGRWWDARAPGGGTWAQVVVPGGGLLLVCRDGRWSVTGSYD